MNKTSTQKPQPAKTTARTDHHKTRPPSLRGRRLTLIDIENISGGAIRTLAEARWAQRMLDSTLGLQRQEQVIVGVSKAGAINTWPVWSPARIVVGTGVDGADHALLNVLNNENIADRFDEVILVSGDGIFTDTVATLGSRGVTVTVVAHQSALAKRLQMAASQTVTFTPTRPTPKVQHEQPVPSPKSLVSSSDIADLAGVSRAAVSNWRRRHDDFPPQAAGTKTKPLYALSQVQTWLTKQGYTVDRISTEAQVWTAMNTLRAFYTPDQASDIVISLVAERALGRASPSHSNCHLSGSRWIPTRAASRSSASRSMPLTSPSWPRLWTSSSSAPPGPKADMGLVWRHRITH
jgi:hypothetical protein